MSRVLASDLYQLPGGTQDLPPFPAVEKELSDNNKKKKATFGVKATGSLMRRRDLKTSCISCKMLFVFVNTVSFYESCTLHHFAFVGFH